MNIYKVNFKSNPSITVEAVDREDAQALAIDILEKFGIVHSEIVSIKLVESMPTEAQFMGNDKDGFACYTNVQI
jgi:hypothetical protein